MVHNHSVIYLESLYSKIAALVSKDDIVSRYLPFAIVMIKPLSKYRIHAWIADSAS